MTMVLKRASVLLLITLVAGFLLSAVYDITADAIAAADAEAERRALRAACPGASDFTAGDYDFDAYLAARGVTGVTMNAVLRARDSTGATVGYLADVTCHEGYGGDIRLILGVDPDGVTTGLSVVSMKETPGLGANCTKPGYTAQFAGLASPAALDALDGITAATYTTEAVEKAVDAGYVFLTEFVLGGRE